MRNMKELKKYLCSSYEELKKQKEIIHKGRYTFYSDESHKKKHNFDSYKPLANEDQLFQIKTLETVTQGLSFKAKETQESLKIRLSSFIVSFFDFLSKNELEIKNKLESNVFGSIILEEYSKKCIFHEAYDLETDRLVLENIPILNDANKDKIFNKTEIFSNGKYIVTSIMQFCQVLGEKKYKLIAEEILNSIEQLVEESQKYQDFLTLTTKHKEDMIKNIRSHCRNSLVNVSCNVLSHIREVLLSDSLSYKLFKKYVVSKESSPVFRIKKYKSLNEISYIVKNNIMLKEIVDFDFFSVGKNLDPDEIFMIDFGNFSIAPVVIRYKYYYEIDDKHSAYLDLLKNRLKSGELTKDKIIKEILKTKEFVKHRQFLNEGYLKDLELDISVAQEFYESSDFFSFEDFYTRSFYYIMFKKYSQDYISEFFKTDNFFALLILMNHSSEDAITEGLAGSLYPPSLLGFVTDNGDIAMVKEYIENQVNIEKNAQVVKDLCVFIRNSFSHKRFHVTNYHKDEHDITFTETSAFSKKKNIKNVKQANLKIKKEIVEINMPCESLFRIAETLSDCVVFNVDKDESQTF